jgi:4-diphosphocytidyl-2-C-methyl-D-erythritol kinase
MADRTTLLLEPAPAKVNLTLRVVSRRADGYHDIESLVVFARIGDRLSFAPGDVFELTLRGSHTNALGAPDDNLVLKAARLLAARVRGLRAGRFVLHKALPVAAGLGGGSADAAAALRLLARTNGLSLDDPRLMTVAREVGADVPACLEPRPRLIKGIGERLSAPLDVLPLAAVLANPGVALPTKDVFAAHDRTIASSGDASGEPAQLDAVLSGDGGALRKASLLALLAAHRNDLERAAISLQPVIADVLAALTALPGCTLARMSGSGATCFALFGSARAANGAAQRLKAAQPSWWVKSTVIGGSS